MANNEDTDQVFGPAVSDLGLHYDDDEFRFNGMSTHEGHLRQNGVLTWFCNETAILIDMYENRSTRFTQPWLFQFFGQIR